MGPELIVATDEVIADSCLTVREDVRARHRGAAKAAANGVWIRTRACLGAS
jgi:hypothetical protein